MTFFRRYTFVSLGSALYKDENDCPKSGDLVVVEFFATGPPDAQGAAPPATLAVCAFGYVCSDSREHHVKNVKDVLSKL